MSSKSEITDCPHNCFTDIEIIKTSFLWTIKKFSLRQEEMGERLESLLFCSADDPQTKWCVWVYPNGIDEESNGFISCFLCLKESIRKQLRVKFIFEFIYGNKKILRISDKLNDFIVNKNLGFSKWAEKSLINDPNDRLISNDELIINCEVLVYGKTKTVSGTDSDPKKPHKLVNDYMKSLFESQKLSDVDIVIGTNKLRAHKFMLSMRSPVFEKMFEHPMKESLNNEVIIDDINEDIFKEVLRFIYTDNVVIKDFNSGSQLLKAAEKYQLIELKEKCEEYLISKLSTETLFEISILAEMYSIEKLKRFAINFFNDNSNEVMKNWEKLS